ncbi:hypothetical protein DLD82_01375 [Methanospirillum stamsii]|uniref:Uncharacterized protein n=1 Tax=Methanospirillum stamsii TaxID=1277351 RepID=A0A2V2NKN8_9EURY|nr:hypothetical protein DLD82_01375 [Methanospirillum stamsii]
MRNLIILFFQHLLSNYHREKIVSVSKNKINEPRIRAFSEFFIQIPSFYFEIFLFSFIGSGHFCYQFKKDGILNNSIV